MIKMADEVRVCVCVCRGLLVAESASLTPAAALWRCVVWAAHAATAA
jgi:hypothetical protein